MKNFSFVEKHVDVYQEDHRFVNTWAVVIFFIFLSIGTCLNLVVFFVLTLSTRKNGILFTVLQLSGVDVLRTYVAILEIWSLNKHSWCFSDVLCPFFLGSESLLNTLLIYLTVCINFHAISKSNFHEFEMQKSVKNPLTAVNDDYFEEDRSLIKRRVSTFNRNITIHYQNKTSTVSVLFPSIMLWFTCLSISVPEFVFSSVFKMKGSFAMCTAILFDINFNKLLQFLIFIFRGTIPIPLLIISTTIVAIKYFRSHTVDKDSSENILNKETHTIKSILLFCFILSIVCVISSLPRHLFSFLHLINQKFEKGNVVVFKMTPLENVFASYFITTITGIVYYSASTLRGVLYVVMLPELNILLRYKSVFSLRKIKV